MKKKKKKENRPTSLIKSSLMSFKSRLLAVYQSKETFYVWWEDFLLAGALESSVFFVFLVPGNTHWFLNE